MTTTRRRHRHGRRSIVTLALSAIALAGTARADIHTPFMDAFGHLVMKCTVSNTNKSTTKRGRVLLIDSEGQIELEQRYDLTPGRTFRTLDFLGQVRNARCTVDDDSGSESGLRAALCVSGPSPDATPSCLRAY